MKVAIFRVAMGSYNPCDGSRYSDYRGRYLNMPETPGKHELLDGELISLPIAKKLHNDISWEFGELLRTELPRPRARIAEGYKASPWLADTGCERDFAQSTSKRVRGIPDNRN
jgi:hypothetical protein